MKEESIQTKVTTKSNTGFFQKLKDFLFTQDFYIKFDDKKAK